MHNIKFRSSLHWLQLNSSSLTDIHENLHQGSKILIHTTAKSTPLGPLLVKWSNACLSLVFSLVRASSTFFETPGVTMAPWLASACCPFPASRLSCVILFSALANEPSKRSFFSKSDLISCSFRCNWSPRFWTPVSFDAIFFLSVTITNNALRRRVFSAFKESKAPWSVNIIVTNTAVDTERKSCETCGNMNAEDLGTQPYKAVIRYFPNYLRVSRRETPVSPTPGYTRGGIICFWCFKKHHSVLNPIFFLKLQELKEFSNHLI